MKSIEHFSCPCKSWQANRHIINVWITYPRVLLVRSYVVPFSFKVTVFKESSGRVSNVAVAPSLNANDVSPSMHKNASKHLDLKKIFGLIATYLIRLSMYQSELVYCNDCRWRYYWQASSMLRSIFTNKRSYHARLRLSSNSRFSLSLDINGLT